MFAIEDEKVFEEIKPAPLLFVLRKPAEDYGWLVREFEEMAQILLARVARVLEEVVQDHRAVTGENWQRETRFLAAELARYPWLLVHTSCPSKYETLGLFYRAWAVACGELESCLRTLARKDDRRPVAIRAEYAQEALAVVLAYTAARLTYLDAIPAR